MANTVSILALTNTFSDQLVAVNALAKENNDLAANNYTKNSGTLYLNDTSLALQVNAPAIFANTLSVTGTGSSATIQNNLTVQRQVFFTNTTLGLVNSGQANVGGILMAIGPNVGVYVSNNQIVNGNLQSNGSTNVLSSLYVGGYSNLRSMLYVAGFTNVANSIQIDTNALVNNLNSNTGVTSTTLSVSGTSYQNVIQGNTSVNTAVLSVTGTSYENIIQGNTSVNTATLSVTATSYLNNVQANTKVNTASLVVTSTGYMNMLQANNNINTAVFVATSNAYVNVLQANSSINTATLNVTGTATLGNISGTTGSITTISSTNVSASSNVVANYLVANSGVNTAVMQSTTINNSGTLTSGTAQINGQLSVGGNFVINGTTVYNSNVFTINANSASGLTSYFNVWRGGGANANATIRWNETSQYFDVANTVNSTYYRMLTQDLMTDSYSTTSSSNPASATAVSSAVTMLNGVNATQNTRIQAAHDTANTKFNSSGGAVTGNVTISTYLNVTSNITGGSIQSSGAITSNTLGNGTLLYTNANTITPLTVQTVTTTGLTTGNTLTTFSTDSYGRVTTVTSTPIAITSSQVSGLAASATTDTSNATNISSGTLNASRLPSSGVGAGWYIYPNVQVDTTGRVVAMSNNTPVTSFNTRTGAVTLSSTDITTALTYTPYNATNPSGYITSAGSSNNATYVNGFATQTQGSAIAAGRVAVSDTNGYMTFGYINSNTANNESITPYQVVVTNGDNFYRKVSLATFGTAITSNVQTNATGTWSISVTGNAGTVTNGLYSSGSYSDPSWLTSLAGSKITGNISGNSTNITAYTINQSVGTTSNVQFTSVGVGTAASGTSGEIRATNNITAYYSDDRLKTRIGNIPDAIAKVLQLNGFYYEANETAQALGYQVKREVGLSAQEVNAVLPEVIAPAPIDEKYMTIHYERVIPLLVEAIKELQREIDVLKNK